MVEAFSQGSINCIVVDETEDEEEKVDEWVVETGEVRIEREGRGSACERGEAARTRPRS